MAMKTKERRNIPVFQAVEVAEERGIVGKQVQITDHSESIGGGPDQGKGAICIVRMNKVLLGGGK